MPVKINDLVKAIEHIAPPALAYDWDNTGIQLRCSDNINKVLITLDITPETAEEAKAKGCDLIISHHPLIFEPLKSLSIENAPQAVAMQLIRNGISVYSAHTSYDRAEGGIGDILARELGLQDICTELNSGEGLMRTGRLMEPLKRSAFLEYIKNTLKVNTVRISNTKIDIIKKVAVVGGSGGDFYKAAKEAGSQALITGEAKHHHFIEAAASGILLVEAGHFETERYFIEAVFMSLQSRLNELQLNVELYRADNVRSPYEYI